MTRELELDVSHTEPAEEKKGNLSRIGAIFTQVPLLGWFFGGLVAVLLERWIGDYLAEWLGLDKIPTLFGLSITVKNIKLMALSMFGDNPAQVTESLLVIFSAILFIAIIYVVPILVCGRLLAGLFNHIAAWLLKFPTVVSVIVHLLLLYAILHLWSDLSPYRSITLRLTLIAVMLTLSLNIINGYMGEFSCSHPGFMSLGAYGASLFSVIFFVNDKLFGEAILPAAMGPFMFPIGLIMGGLLAAFGALVIAIPSFRTRGDYLAIISLAFMFIVKSLIENINAIGGPRGLAGQPDWASLPTVFIWTVLCVWIINNFVRSTMGKALNAVRDDEMAADAMTVNTRRTKMVAFMFAAFWAGIAGGLFAHVIRFINPATFGIQRLAEVLAMVYFGGLNSVYGSILGAVSLSLLSETLKPLNLIKWIIIPLILILIMIFRPTGLIAFKEFKVLDLIRPKQKR